MIKYIKKINIMTLLIVHVLILNFNARAESTIKAMAILDQKHSTIKWTIYFTNKIEGPTSITGKIEGLFPGKYGFHIHEKGDISSGCKSAGGHYNPTNQAHGTINNGHVGDLGNIISQSSDGLVKIDLIAARIKLYGEFSVVNRTIMIHGKEDDLGKKNNEGSKKTGNAGPRIGCGIIKIIHNSKP